MYRIKVIDVELYYECIISMHACDPKNEVFRWDESNDIFDGDVRSHCVTVTSMLKIDFMWQCRIVQM